MLVNETFLETQCPLDLKISKILNVSYHLKEYSREAIKDPRSLLNA